MNYLIKGQRGSARRGQIGRLVFTAVLGIALVACTEREGPTEPTNAATIQLAPSQVRKSVTPGSVNGDVITVYDEDNARFDLNLATNEMHTPDATIELQPEQALTAANAFRAIINGQKLDAALHPTTGGTKEPLPEPYSIGGTHGRGRSRKGTSIMQEDPTAIIGDSSGSGGTLLSDTTTFTESGLPPGDIIATSPDYTLALGDYGPSCYDIANGIYYTTQFLKSKQSAFLSFAKTEGLRVAQNTLTGKAPLTAEKVITWDLYGYTTYAAWVQLNLYASMYNNYGCWSSDWTSGGDTFGGGGTTSTGVGGGYVYTCHHETIWVSLAGGGWRSIDATVCEYQVQ